MVTGEVFKTSLVLGLEQRSCNQSSADKVSGVWQVTGDG